MPSQSSTQWLSRPIHGRMVYRTRWYLRALWVVRRTPGRTLLVGRTGHWQVRSMEDA